MANIAELLREQEILKTRINKMVYGSIEIREHNDKKISMCIFAMEAYLHLNMLVNLVLN